MSTAKVIITNVKNALPFTKKKEQFLIMTWHGEPAGFKEIEQEAESQLSPQYVAESKANSAITDLMIVATKKGFEIMRKYFWYDGEIMKSGLPRNDIFFNHDKKFVEDIRQSLNIPQDNKIVMYAPTFRDGDSNSIEVYKFDYQKLLDIMKNKFGGEWTLLLRLHPNSYNLGISENIIDVTKYSDPQELILISDVLISDYSSVVYDFMISHKPVFILAKDIETYPKERRLKQGYFETPLKKNKTEDELFECIKNFDREIYDIDINKFISQIESYDDGHAAERVVNVIKKVIDN